jgi:hypothetical protein
MIFTYGFDAKEINGREERTISKSERCNYTLLQRFFFLCLLSWELSNDLFINVCRICVFSFCFGCGGCEGDVSPKLKKIDDGFD